MGEIRFVSLFRHLFDECVDLFVAAEVAPVDIASLWYVMIDIACTPINGDTARRKAIEDLFRHIAVEVADVFIAESKSVVFKHIELIGDFAAIGLVTLRRPAESVKFEIV